MSAIPLGIYCSPSPWLTPAVIVLCWIAVACLLAVRVNSDPNVGGLLLRLLPDRSWEYYKWSAGFNAATLGFALITLSSLGQSRCPGFIVGASFALAISTLLSLMTVKFVLLAELFNSAESDSPAKADDGQPSRVYRNVQAYGQAAQGLFLFGTCLIAISIMTNLGNTG